VTDPFRDDYTYLTELPEELRDQRREAARRRRWRRRLAALVVLAVIGAVAAVAVTTIVDDGSGGEQQPGEATTQVPAVTTPAYPAGWEPHLGPVPILEYHAIQPPVAGAESPQTFVPQADFQRQMRWLADRGYEGVTLGQVQAAWYEQGELPAKPIVVSFDDGYLSQYVAGFPELQRLGWKGVVNLVARDSDLPEADVEKMLDAGWELGSHTITNADLTTVDPAQLEREVAGSRQILERRFGVRVDNFTYPSGYYDDRVITAVRAAGYVGAQAEVPGLATAANPYILNRIGVELDDGLRGFVAKLRSAGAA
jgi:peptidoglycan/xylan/chitin deacetylase (PgdA/CDA1 family)